MISLDTLRSTVRHTDRFHPDRLVAWATLAGILLGWVALAVTHYNEAREDHHMMHQHQAILDQLSSAETRRDLEIDQSAKILSDHEARIRSLEGSRHVNDLLDAPSDRARHLAMEIDQASRRAAGKWPPEKAEGSTQKAEGSGQKAASGDPPAQTTTGASEP